jgi:hypothetical protein
MGVEGLMILSWIFGLATGILVMVIRRPVAARQLKEPTVIGEGE